MRSCASSAALNGSRTDAANGDCETRSIEDEGIVRKMLGGSCFGLVMTDNGSIRSLNPFTSTVVSKHRAAVEVFLGQARRRGNGCSRQLLPLSLPLTETRRKRRGILGGHHRSPGCGLHLRLLRRRGGLHL